MQTIEEVGKIVKQKANSKTKKVIFFLSSFIATGCFVGKIKYAPGTFGSLLAIFLCIPFVKLSIVYQCIILSFILFIGTFTTHMYLVKINDLKKDPKEVVVDEIFAVFLLTFLAQIITPNFEWHHFLSIFVLFRTFDIIKPYPISYVDKNIHGSIGIMLDDILASIGSFLVYIIAYDKHSILF